MTRQRAAALTAMCLSIVTIVSAQGTPPRQESGGAPVGRELHDRADREGHVRVLVELRSPGAPAREGRLPDVAAVAAQRTAVGAVRARVLAKLPPTGHRVIRRYDIVPFVALEVTPEALSILERSSTDVARVLEDAILIPVLAESVPMIQADQIWASGYDGTGTMVAILDTGVDRAHAFLGGRVTEEACFSSTVSGTSVSVCPNGTDEQSGPGSAAPCALETCLHGTHVAGIAAGNGALAGQPFSGVAKNAEVMAVQVFSQIVDPVSCGGIVPCLGAFSSDIIAGLDRVYTLAPLHNLVAVNMSFGGGAYSASCDDQPYKIAIDNLRAIGIASVTASGNDGSSSSLTSPGCISSAVSVGSVDKNDTVSWFSNIASFLSLLAPGGSITSSVPGGGFQALSGTSMATPHVTGSWALMRQALPGGGVSTILDALRQTGRPIRDTRFFGTATIPRVRIFEALASVTAVTNPAPVLSTVSPTAMRGGTGPVTVTVNGSGFDAFSTLTWNGSARPTSVISTTKLQASIGAADLVVGTAQVAVYTPAPGGGTSSSVVVKIDPPPTLTVSTTTAAAGSPVTVTLANGYGGVFDWFALGVAGGSNMAFIQWTPVGSGVTARSWTTTMPATVGTYEFRLYLNNGFTRAATSPSITVVQPVNPVPALTTLSPAGAITGGPGFTMTVTGAGFVSSSVVRWNGADRATTFVSSSQLRAAIPPSDLASPGSAQVAVFSPGPGGGLSSALSFTTGVAPTLTVNAITALTNATVTVTVINGVGGPYDWLVLAPAGAPATSYLQWTYIGSGVTTRTWTVPMPATAGTYEFRLLLNNGFTVAATSPAVSVVAGPNRVPAVTSLSPSAAIIPSADLSVVGKAQVTVFTPAPAGGLSNAVSFTIGEQPILTVSATSVAPGATVTMTLTNGLGGASDWLALALSSAPNTSYVRWVPLAPGATTRTWTLSMPTTPGVYEFRLFPNNGYTRAATSPPVVVNP
jgi:subtilisin family serine protease